MHSDKKEIKSNVEVSAAVTGLAFCSDGSVRCLGTVVADSCSGVPCAACRVLHLDKQCTLENNRILSHCIDFECTYIVFLLLFAAMETWSGDDIKWMQLALEQVSPQTAASGS